jgi:hypothetical protein
VREKEILSLHLCKILAVAKFTFTPLLVTTSILPLISMSKTILF